MRGAKPCENDRSAPSTTRFPFDLLCVLVYTTHHESEAPRPQWGKTRQPADALGAAATKAALRLQGLPSGRCYQIVLVKQDNEWLLSVLNEKGNRLEKLNT